LPSIKEIARELGHALYESDEAAVLHAAETNMSQDKEAQALIADFQTRQKKIEDAQEAGQEVSEEEWNEFNRIQETMKENKSLLAYFAAMQRFQKLLQDANTEINNVLKGDACSPSECDSCSLDCRQ
jgi:cell fate (sporulation/competence/biofilm development) regulator YlbF (YheA/YmcA/DUF963 family)